MPLLGKDTTMNLGVLKTVVNIAKVAETTQTLQEQFLEVFSDVGKLKTRQVTLHIYLEVKPVA